MKKINLLLALMVLTTFFTSCDVEQIVEDELELLDEGTVEASIVGTWNLTGHELTNGKTITEADGLSITTDYSTIGKDFDFKMTFAEDPNVATSEGSFTSVITTSLQGQSSTQEVPIDNLFSSGEWEVVDGSIVFNADGEETTVEIVSSTATKLVLSFDLNETFEIGGASSTSTGVLMVTLEK